jgi:hypothetical protein
MKPNKADVDYRLPDDCCAQCEHSFQSIYGDFQCVQLETGNVIDAGGICDLYNAAIETATIIPDIEPVVEEIEVLQDEPKDCIHCSYSYLEQGKPRCALDGQFIEDVNDYCGGFNSFSGESDE